MLRRYDRKRREVTCGGVGWAKWTDGIDADDDVDGKTSFGCGGYFCFSWETSAKGVDLEGCEGEDEGYNMFSRR